ncbi:hypothetical protein TNCV_2679451 [Trichonephila clavipes]|nr:hypothetical protein TNCV_2679451 [Trichonephila clavipes]
MSVCKCIVPVRHGSTLNICPAASLLAWLMKEKRWDPLDVLPQNWGGTKPMGAKQLRTNPIEAHETHRSKLFVTIYFMGLDLALPSGISNHNNNY